MRCCKQLILFYIPVNSILFAQSAVVSCIELPNGFGSAKLFCEIILRNYSVKLFCEIIL